MLAVLLATMSVSSCTDEPIDSVKDIPDTEWHRRLANTAWQMSEVYQEPRYGSYYEWQGPEKGTDLNIYYLFFDGYDRYVSEDYHYSGKFGGSTIQHRGKYGITQNGEVTLSPDKWTEHGSYRLHIRSYTPEQIEAQVEWLTWFEFYKTDDGDGGYSFHEEMEEGYRYYIVRLKRIN